MNELFRRFGFWLNGPSLTSKALVILGEVDLLPSRVFKDNDGVGVVSLYFFKPMADSYALLVIDEEAGLYYAFIKDGNTSSPVIVIKDDELLRRWAHEVQDWKVNDTPVVL